MEMIYSGKDLGGNWWREITCRQEKPLQELASEYRRKGCRTWIKPCEDKHVLTVMEPTKEEFTFGIAI